MALSGGFQMPERKKYDLLPDDIYEVEIKELKDEENSVYQKPEEKEMQILFTFEIVEEGEYKGRLAWKRARPNFFAGQQNGKPSTLYSIWKAVNGKVATQEEADLFGPEEINSLQGKRLRVHVFQKPKQDGGLKNDISDFLPLKKSAGELPKGAARMSEDGIPVYDDDEPKEVDPKDIPF